MSSHRFRTKLARLQWFLWNRLWNLHLSTTRARSRHPGHFVECGVWIRQRGATFIVFLWPAFWWLDYYNAFHYYLVSNFPCVLRNDWLVVFNLKSKDSVRRRSLQLLEPLE
jgi:hypothetical protein